MRELRPAQGEAVRDAALLAAEASRLGQRLAALLASVAPQGAPAIPAPAPELSGSSRPLARLVEALRLSPVERDALLLAGLAEESEAWAAALRLVHPRGEPRATTGLLMQLLCRAPEERWLLRGLLEDGALVRHGALAVSGAAPFSEQNVTLGEALWPALGGLDVWPPGLRASGLPAVHSGLEAWLAEPEPREAARWLALASPVVLLVAASTEEVAFERARVLVARAGALATALEPRPGWTPDLERLALVHAALRGALPVLLCRAADGPAVALPDCATACGPVVLCVREGAAAFRGDRPVLQLRVAPLPHASRVELWREELPELAGDAPMLAARYHVEPSLTRRVARDARVAAALDRRPPSLDDVARSVRARANLATGAGVNLVVPRAGWSSLVLPAEVRARLEEAVGRLLHQGTVIDGWGLASNRAGSRGVRMLFAGPPGTGKSLSAEVLASALGVDVLSVDISRVVSKWLGETEKNLAAVFDAAERAQAVLFFDEADALFGARTEVSDAHDRYANLETAYLLARLERFEGLVVLATNMKENIDPAFLRRLEFVVDFEEPGLAERAGLWRAHLPASVPLADDVNLEELAAFYPMVGSLIRNAALAAAFLAAQAGTPVSRLHLLRAIRREFDKTGRAFPGEPYRHTEPRS